MATLPAHAPTSWELTLPGWPVITNSWRSSEFPEILGSLPEGAQLSLRYENVTDAEALELLLLWRATAGGVHALDPLPAQIAAGISDAALADRILDVAPMVWKVATEPRQESVKAGRSTVEIELRAELALALNSTLPVTACPAWSPRAAVSCVGGAGGVGPPPVKPLPPLILPPGPVGPTPGRLFGLSAQLPVVEDSGRPMVTSEGKVLAIYVEYNTTWLHSIFVYDPINGIANSANVSSSRINDSGFRRYRPIGGTDMRHFWCYTSPQQGELWTTGFDGNGTKESITKMRLYRIRFNADGTLGSAASWDRTFSTADNNSPYPTLPGMTSGIHWACYDQDGNCYISFGIPRTATGTATLEFLPGEQASHHAIIKINANGSVGWQKWINNHGMGRPERLWVTGTSLVIVTGRGGFNGSGWFKLSTGTGELESGPYRLDVVGYYWIGVKTAAAGGSKFVSIENDFGGLKGGIVIKGDVSNWTVDWKYRITASALIEAQASNTQVVDVCYRPATDTYILSQRYTVGDYPGHYAEIASDGTPIKAWTQSLGVVMPGQSFMASTESTYYGSADNNAIFADGTHTLCLPLSLDLSGSTTYYASPNGTVNFGPIDPGSRNTLTNTVQFTAGHPNWTTGDKVVTQPGNSFAPSSNAVALESFALGSGYTNRFQYGNT